jgi:hypothetical protein
VLEQHGLAVLEQRKSLDDVRVIFQLWNCYVYKRVARKGSLAKVLAMLLLMAPANVLGQLLALVTPRNEDLFLDNVVLARKVERP